MIGRLAALLITLLAISIGGVFILWRWWPPTPGSFSLELANALVQLATVSVAGAIISLLTSEFQRQRAAEDKKRDEARLDAEKSKEKARQDAERERVRERRVAENRDEFLR